MPLLPDEPIADETQDILGRGHLVDSLATHILARQTLETVVIGVNAPWGAGKTSFLNLLETNLSSRSAPADTHPPVIIQFNPWHYTSVEQLVRMLRIGAIGWKFEVAPMYPRRQTQPQLRPSKPARVPNRRRTRGPQLYSLNVIGERPGPGAGPHWRTVRPPGQRNATPPVGGR